MDITSTTALRNSLLATEAILDSVELAAAREGKPYQWSPAQAVRDAIKELDDKALIDWIAAHWESQRYEKQTLLGGRAIENETGSLRDALRADIRRHDTGTT